MTVVLGPLPCQGCSVPVTWNGKQWKQSRTVHRCAVRCGAFMPSARERCQRKPGHGYEHRSEYAMQNARAMRSGRGVL